MNYLILDLEATCWEGRTPTEKMEIIEIGAVWMPTPDAEPTREFARFVKPVAEPKLSEFCTHLTSIQQSDVDSAEVFSRVLPQFLDWIGEEEYTLCSWGAYDLRQLRVDCARHGLPFPPTFERHINLKQAFGDQRRIKPPGMARALEIAGIPLAGTHHRGIDDARNIAKLARLILPKLTQ